MKAYSEAGSFSEYKDTKEVQALQAVLKVIENLFFSMPIPEEIISKYNFLKEAKFKAAGLYFTPITKSQLPMRATNQSDKEITTLSIDIMETWIKAIQQLKQDKTCNISQTITKAHSNKNCSKFLKVVEELNDTYMNEIKSLASFYANKEAQYNELKKIIEAQKTETNTLNKIVKTINGRLKGYYEENAKEKVSNTKLDDPLGCSELIIEYMMKLSNDNQWLVEKLAEFGKENETLKKTTMNPEVLKEISNAKSLIKTFQKNYNELTLL